MLSCSISSPKDSDHETNQSEKIQELEEKLRQKEFELQSLRKQLSDLIGLNLDQQNYISSELLLKKKLAKNIQTTSEKGIFRDERIQQKSYKIGKKRLKIEHLATHVTEQDDSAFTTDWTYLALKSPSSYMVGSYKKGIILIDEDTEIFSKKLPEEFSSLKDLIYIDLLDSYLLSHEDQLSIKKIDEESPKTFLKLETCYRRGGSFRYCKRHQRLLVNKRTSIISVINLENREIEIEVKFNLGNRINDFRL